MGKSVEKGGGGGGQTSLRGTVLGTGTHCKLIRTLWTVAPMRSNGKKKSIQRFREFLLLFFRFKQTPLFPKKSGRKKKSSLSRLRQRRRRRRRR